MIKKNNFSIAMKFLKQALEIQPSESEKSLVLFYMGYVSTQICEYEKAISFLNEAILLSRDNHIFYNLRGTCYFKLKKYREALNDFFESLNVNRGSIIDLANIGMCYKMLGKKEKAIIYLEKALLLDSTIKFAENALYELKN
jgi:ribosomal protein S12 methylthiotransferase accessory factor